MSLEDQTAAGLRRQNEELRASLAALERRLQASAGPAPDPASPASRLEMEILRLAARSSNVPDLIRRAVALIREHAGFEAIGVRLREGSDFPYYETNGFSTAFVRIERSLQRFDNAGRLICGHDGEPLMECCCGAIVSGSIDRSLPGSTPAGGFWTNHASAETSATSPRVAARGTCLHTGYESVGLFPLRTEDRILGLLQLNDKRTGLFTPESVALWGEVAEVLALTVDKLRTEESLRDRHRLVQSILATDPHVVILKDAAGVYREVSRSFCELMGQPREALVGRTDFDSLPLELASRLRDTELQVMREGKPAEFEMLAPTPLGIRRYTMLMNPVMASDGAYSSVFCAAIDITEQTRVAMELRLSEEKFAKAFRLSPAAMSISELCQDGVARFLDISAAYEELTGYSREDAIGRTEAELNLFEPGLRADLAALVRARGAARDLEVTFRRKDGALRTGLLSVDSANLNGRNLILAFAIDITERKRAEEALRESERRTRAILQTAMDGFWLVDMDGRILEVNAAYCRMSGYTEAEMLRLRVADLEELESSVDVAARIRDLKDRDEARFESRHRRKDGSAFPVEVSLQYRPDGEGYVASFFRDLTERDRAQEELARSQEVMSVAQASVNFGVYRWNLHTGECYWSPEVFRLHGLAPESTEASIDEWMSSIYPPDRERIASEIGEHMRSRQDAVGLEYRSLDGSRWLAGSGRISRDAQGTPESIVGIIIDMTQRKAEEDALRDSEERWKYALEGSGDGVWDWNIPARQVHYTRQWKTILGYADEDIGSGIEEWEDRVHPDDRERVWAVLDRHLRGEDPAYSCEHRLRCKDGSYKWILDRGKVLSWTPDGKPLRMIGTHSDIGDRKRAEDESRVSQKRLEDITFSVGDWIWEVNERGLYTYSSGKSFDLFGPERGDVLGKSPFDFMAPEEVARVGAIFADASARKAPVRDLENWCIGKDGERICLLTNGVPILDAVGNLKGYRGVGKDITLRKKTEADLALLGMAMQQAAETIVITDPSGNILYANPAFETSSGYSVEEAIGKNPRLLKSGYHDAAFYSAMWETLSRGEVWRGRLHNRRKDGALFQEEATISPIRDSQGRVSGYLALKLDVTKQAELQAQLMQAQKMESIGRLAGGVAHDFNNLLTVINGYSKLALGDLSEADPLRTHLEEIRAAGDRAAGLTQQLLAFSRKQIMQPKAVDLNQIVRSIGAMLRRLVAEDVELAFALAPGEVVTFADPHQIGQVVMNLALNGRDAMPAGGVLTVRTAVAPSVPPGEFPDARPGPYAVITVNDTGAGMDEATRSRVFEPFFTTKAVGKGTGLGLSMVQGIVVQSGGYVGVNSAPGRGTTFQVFLPLVAGPVEAEPDLPALPHPHGRETVLVVEDQAEVRTFTMAVLKRLGYRALAAPNAAEALAICERDAAIHLVLTDIVMPNLSGPAFVERLKTAAPGIRRALFMSGYAESALKAGLSPGGHVPFLQKPFSPEQLAAKVREVLDGPPTL
jgi:two-component system, cell cycle sensor histidine kinase and response regulator CckA